MAHFAIKRSRENIEVSDTLKNTKKIEKMSENSATTSTTKTDTENKVKPDEQTVIEPETIKDEEEDEYAGKEPVIHEPSVLVQVPMAFSVITAPKVCPTGYRLDATGKCRRIL